MDILNNSICSQKAKNISKYIIASYLGYQTAKYVYWRYRNKQIREKARQIRQKRDNSMYSFAEVPNAKFILSLDVT